MEDILPSRRIAVDRLRRRLELYRRHQDECDPRYTQTSHGLYEQQRHETLLLKQRYLESKAKKVRKNDHKASKDNCGERNLLVGPKLSKRTAEVLGSPVTSDGHSDDHRHPNKIPRTNYPSDQGPIQTGNCDNKDSSQQSHQQQSSLPSHCISVQIVQQFTSSNVSQTQHSQTIQTNVTVQSLNGTVKTSDSPLATATNSVSTDSPSVPGSTISVGANVECKQEKELTGQCCNHTTNDDLPNLDPSNDGPSRVERFSDTFSNLNFPEDSGDDVFHSDILKDLIEIEDVFTNPSDLLIFEDSVGSVKDGENEKDILASTMLDMGKLVGTQSASPQFSRAQLSTGQPSHSTSSLFDLGVTVANNLNSPGVSATSFQNSSNLSSLGLDFKLTEPSPAALTLKQMAEQHQNMQQKQQQQHQPSPQQQQQQQQQQQVQQQKQQQQQQQQQQHQHHQQQQQQPQQTNISLGLGSPHSRSPFAENFSDTLNSIRTNFINNNASNNLSQVQKTGIYQTMGFSRQQGYQNIRPSNGMIFKQENFTSNPAIDDLQKRQNIQQQINDQKLRPTYCGNVNLDQKPPLGLATRTYGATRPLSHFTEPQGQGQRQSPGFLRAQGPRITPPPSLQYGTTGVPRSPSATNIHLSQSQQIQINQNNQHMQVSQEQQLRLDAKQNVTSANQQQSGLYVNYSPNSNASGGFHMSQMQKVNFGNAQYNTDNSHQPMNQASLARFVPQQRPPPPDYARHAGTGGAMSVQQHMMRDNSRGLVVGSQNPRLVQQTTDMNRRGINRTYQDNMQSQIALHQNPPPPHYSQQDTANRPDLTTNKPIYTNALSKQQRPPNVNVGPDGLNISQRPPGLNSEWRQNFLTLPQLGGGIRSQGAVRIPYNRPPTSHPQITYHQNLTTNLDSYVTNQSAIRMAGTTNRLQRPPAAVPPVSHHQNQVVQSSHLTVSNSGHAYSGQLTSPPVTVTTANQLFDAVQLPVTTTSSITDNAQFNLDFLDNLECSTSDLLSFEQVIQGPDSPFPLLDDMGLLGK